MAIVWEDFTCYTRVVYVEDQEITSATINKLYTPVQQIDEGSL